MKFQMVKTVYLVVLPAPPPPHTPQWAILISFMQKVNPTKNLNLQRSLCLKENAQLSKAYPTVSTIDCIYKIYNFEN